MSSTPENQASGQVLIAVGAVFAALAVAFGAFGAHALAGQLGPGALAQYRTAVDYQFIHALGIIGAGAAAGLGAHPRWLQAAAALLIAGVLMFSGSLYLLALTGTRAWGIIAPLGGVAFIAGWCALAVGALRRV